MNGFALELASGTQWQRVEGVMSFVGTDASGRFGLMPGHEPLATVLAFGLARFRLQPPKSDGPADEALGWRYLALPGGVLRFANNQLWIATRRYVLGEQLDAVQAALEQDMRGEQLQQADLRHNLEQLENTLMQRLWRLERMS